jgi:hypothetical protein
MRGASGLEVFTGKHATGSQPRTRAYPRATPVRLAQSTDSYPYDLSHLDYSKQLIQAGTWRQFTLTRNSDGVGHGFVGTGAWDKLARRCPCPEPISSPRHPV